jgi:predicted transcriptional regulator
MDLIKDEEPKSYWEAVRVLDRDLCKEAIKKELSSLYKVGI